MIFYHLFIFYDSDLKLYDYALFPVENSKIGFKIIKKVFEVIKGFCFINLKNLNKFDYKHK
jgi:hypothetical protein